MKFRSLMSVVFAFGVCWVGCDRHRNKEFSPTAPGTAEALMLEVTANSIPADGFSRVLIKAEITAEADLKRRRIQFESDGGRFVGTPADGNGRTTTADVDTKGAVSVELQSDTVPRVVTVTAKVLDTTNEASPTVIPGLVVRASIEFTPPDPKQVITISSSDLEGEADGFTQILVHADIAPGLPAGSRTVEFTTTLGDFIKDGQMTKTAMATADRSHRATVALKSPSTVGTARLTAKVSDTTVGMSLPFKAALPDLIRVEITKAKLARGEETLVKATLERSPGQGSVSERTEVQYTAIAKQSGDTLAVVFRNRVPSNAAGEATTMMSVGTVEFVGTATVRATVAGSPAVGEEDVEIDAPPVAQPPDISADAETVDFGPVTVGMSADRTISITNAGGTVLSVTAITVSGDGFSLVAPPPLPSAVAPGGQILPVAVRFMPAAAGAASGMLEITSDDPDEATLTVALAGQGM